MARGENYINFILNEREQILDFLEHISFKMHEYVQKKTNSKFILFYKHLTHSDLATFGKATRPQDYDKNLLYYLSVQQMLELEKEHGFQFFKSAHQSCIGLMKNLYTLMNLPQPRENEQYSINDYSNVYLVNENLKYFNSSYTKKVLDNLQKKDSYGDKFDNVDVVLNNQDYTPIELHCARHGLGTSADVEFHKLRHHLFKGDMFIILHETPKYEKPNMYLLFEKNPVFFTIIGESNKTFEDYQNIIHNRLISTVQSSKIQEINDAVTRKEQNAWRQLLAKEMMAYTNADNIVFCPLTYITANFNNLGSLFVASHIKAFSDPNTSDSEKYDINNGLLLSANADALFDKHLISIDQNKNVIFSFLFDLENASLKQQLLLQQPIFKTVFNDARMNYLNYHYNLFVELEQKRKTELSKRV